VSANTISEMSFEPLAVIQSTNMKMINANGMTLIAGELMARSGRLNSYPEGKLGLIEEGAYADI